LLVTATPVGCLELRTLPTAKSKDYNQQKCSKKLNWNVGPTGVGKV
jgi:hypothetical protein